MRLSSPSGQVILSAVRRLAWGLIAAQVAVVDAASAYVETRPSAADVAGQRACHLILAKPFHSVVEDGVQAQRLRVDATRIGTSHRWKRVASDLGSVLQALSPDDRKLVAWDGPSPRMIQDCRDAM
jgi:hypothetical protein